MTSHTVIPTLKDIPNLDDIKKLLIDRAYSLHSDVIPIRRNITLLDDIAYTVEIFDDIYCKVIFWYNTTDGSSHVVSEEGVCHASNM